MTSSQHFVLPVRGALLKAIHTEPTPHRVRTSRKQRGFSGPTDARRKGEERAAWLLWLLQRLPLKEAAAALGMPYRSAWAIARGETHPLTAPKQPPEDVWKAKA